MAFQTSVNTQPAPGIEGGFYGFNPHFTLTHPDEGMWVAGAVAPFIGRFGWANPANGQVTSAHPGVATFRVGFVHRDQPAVANINWLSGASNQALPGAPIDILEDGPMWGRFAGGATINQKVYASYADGSLRAGVTATPATASRSVTTTNGSANFSFTGTAPAPGQPISGTGIPASAYVVSVNTTAGTGVLSANATASGTITATVTTDFETSWTCRSSCAANELAKLSVRG